MKRFVFALFATLVAASGLSAPAQAQYAIQPGDTLRIEVLEDASLNRNVLVLPDGSLNFPLVGTIRAAGQSVSSVRSTLASALASNFATAPNVYVTVANLATPQAALAEKGMGIYAMGEIANPGVIQAEEGITILQAVAQAGGFTRFAATKRVQLRRVVGGKEQVYTFDYKRGGGISAATVLQAGDVIVVPERGLFE